MFLITNILKIFADIYILIIVFDTEKTMTQRCEKLSKKEKVKRVL